MMDIRVCSYASTMKYHKMYRLSCNKARQQGFTLMEVTLGMVIAVMMITVFAAVFPLAVAASKYSNNYGQASMLVQHKIDQLHMVSWSGISNNSSGLAQVQTNLNGMVDSGSCSSSFPMTCNFTNTDNLVNNGSNVGYFPIGSSGTLLVSPD